MNLEAAAETFSCVLVFINRADLTALFLSFFLRSGDDDGE